MEGRACWWRTRLRDCGRPPSSPSRSLATEGRVQKDFVATPLDWSCVRARVADVGAFTFPRHMPFETAQELLAKSYGELDEGKLLRRTNKALRKADIDPPMDVQYVAEPAVAEFEDG